MNINSFSYFIFTCTLLIFYDISDCIPVIQSSTPPLPPLLFPQDPQIYKIVPPNETALKILQNSEKHVQVQTSLFPRERLFLDDPRREVFKVHSNMHADDIPEIFPSEYAANLKNEVEEIQPEDKEKSKVELEEQFRSVAANLRATDIFPEDIETHSTKLNHGHITAILVGSIFLICIAIYAALISWRTYLEKRYGMRERLVTHDDYYNNDTRQFDVNI